MTTETEELMARLPEIEAKARRYGIRSFASDETILTLCAAVRELAAEIKALEPFVGHTLDLVAEVERLRTGLEHYADPENWDDNTGSYADTYVGSPIVYCGGKGGPEYARQVLGSKDGLAWVLDEMRACLSKPALTLDPETGKLVEMTVDP